MSLCFIRFSLMCLYFFRHSQSLHNSLPIRQTLTLFHPKSNSYNTGLDERFLPRLRNVSYIDISIQENYENITDIHLIEKLHKLDGLYDNMMKYHLMQTLEDTDCSVQTKIEAIEQYNKQSKTPLLDTLHPNKMSMNIRNGGLLRDWEFEEF